jgi:hypothetical protein
MRKWMPSFACVLLVLVAVAPNTILAASIEKANHKDIEMLLNAASGVNSAYRASLIGETRGRVYIEYETAVHASSLFSKKIKRVVYWLERTEITEEELAQFKVYEDKYELRP